MMPAQKAPAWWIKDESPPQKRKEKKVVLTPPKAEPKPRPLAPKASGMTYREPRWGQEDLGGKGKGKGKSDRGWY